MSTLAGLTTDGREQLVAEIAREVVLRLRSTGAPAREPLAAAARPAALGHGVFATVDAAVEAAASAQRRVQAMSLEERGLAIAVTLPAIRSAVAPISSACSAALTRIRRPSFGVSCRSSTR